MTAINNLHYLSNLADGCGINLILTDSEADRDKEGYHHKGNDSAGVEQAILDAANKGFNTVWVHYNDTPETCPIMDNAGFKGV